MTIKAVLQAHLTRYPAMQTQDVYKLLHQAALGSEHAITNPEGARQRLESELAEMGVGPDEPMFDPISADEQIVRVHLRPFVAQGGDPEMLLSAFIKTANEFHGGTDTLESYWKIAVKTMCFPSKEMDHFIKSMYAKNYPALHHSAVYESTYRPAYRVVLRTLIDG